MDNSILYRNDGSGRVPGWHCYARIGNAARFIKSGDGAMNTAAARSIGPLAAADPGRGFAAALALPHRHSRLVYAVGCPPS